MTQPKSINPFDLSMSIPSENCGYRYDKTTGKIEFSYLPYGVGLWRVNLTAVLPHIVRLTAIAPNMKIELSSDNDEISVEMRSSIEASSEIVELAEDIEVRISNTPSVHSKPLQHMSIEEFTEYKVAAQARQVWVNGTTRHQAKLAELMKAQVIAECASIEAEFNAGQ